MKHYERVVAFKWGMLKMSDEKVITIHDRIPKLKEQRKQRANRRLIFFLSFFFFLILLVVYFQSPLSHVRSIEVSGNYYIADETILKASNIHVGTSMWNIDKDAEANIVAIDEIKSVEIKRVFPTTISINVKEYVRVAYLYEDEKYYPIIETGKFLREIGQEEFPADAPILKNWEQGTVVEELATELTKLPDNIGNRISEIYHTPIDSDPLRITLFMNDGYEVHSTVRNFSELISPYPSIVKELGPGKQGIIHMRMSPYFEEYNTEEAIESEGER